jgi:multiple sugar transport system substrate-binding protein
MSHVIFALSALLLCLASRVSAAPSDPWAGVDPTGQKLVFWHNHTRGRQEALAAIVGEFNRSNPYRITVTQEHQGRYEDIFHKMLGVLNTPDAPDLVVAYQNQAATYQLAGALIDLTPLLESPTWGLSPEDQKDFFPAFLRQDLSPLFRHARLGLAPNRSTEVLYYNSEWLRELGVNAPPANAEEFKAITCKAAKTPFSKSTAAGGSMGYAFDFDASRLASWIFAMGGDIFDEQKVAYTYDSAVAQHTLTYLRDLFKAGCAAAVSERFGDQTDFGAGRLLFTTASSSALPFYKDAVDNGARFAWSVAPLPHRTPTPVMNVYGASVSLPKTTPQRQLAAWLFLKYYTSPPVQARWGMEANYFPVRQSAAVSLQQYFERNPAYKTAFDLLAVSKYEPSVPGYDFVRDLVAKAMAAILIQGAEVRGALEKLNRESNESLLEQMRGLPTGPKP